MAELTHSALVARAASWLANTRRCVLVVQEMSCWATREFPDAMGWLVNGYSILVECKTSRADFLRDAYKPSRRTGEETLGRERWYLTPPGLLTLADLPYGYGLLEAGDQRLRSVVRASTAGRPGRQNAELPLLIALARREAWAGGWACAGAGFRRTRSPPTTI